MAKPYERYIVYARGEKRETMARSKAEAISRVVGGQMKLAGDYEYYEVAGNAEVINIDEKEREEKIKMNLGFDLKDWNETEAIEFGEYETLELGGHEVVIKNAELYESPVSHNTSLKIEVDIAGSDKQAGFYQRQFDDNMDANKRWPSGATRYLSLKKESLGYTKGTITAIEKSNNGFKFDTSKGWEQLKGLKCAGVFGLEQYLNNEGQTKTATKLVQFRSLDKLNEIKIPNVKLLNGSTMPYEEYMKNATASSVKPEDIFTNEVTIDENFLD